MRTARGTAGALIVVGLAACAGKKTAPEEPKPPVEKVFDVRGQAGQAAPDGGVEKHVHSWEQVGIHPYQVMREGLPNTELCVISRCSKCGATRHDCETRVRRR